MKKTVLAILIFLCLPSLALAQIPTPTVPVGGALGPNGVFGWLNGGTIASSDANYTMVYPNTSCFTCNVTGTWTAARTWTLPAVANDRRTIGNNTTGGYPMPILPSAGLSIPNGTWMTVWYNGTNYVQIDGVPGGTGFAAANFVYAGPSSGPAAPPTFRNLVSADIPNNAANTTGNAATSTALAVVPSQCSSGPATGIAANGNANCATNTGSGNNVLQTSPSLITPNLGTPSAAVLTNATGLPLTTGVTGQLPNANLANPSTSVNGQTCTLGSACTVTAIASSAPFNTITTGTNTTASLTVGSGATLAPSGTGTIAATSAPYSGLTGTVPTWNQNTTGTAAALSGASTYSIYGANASTTPAWMQTITLGTPGYSDTGVSEQYTRSVAGYFQNILQNTSSAANASADLIVQSNLGTAATYYGDFGMNSSTFSGSGSLNLPNATYLTATSGDLVLGTTTANALHILANGASTDAITVSTANVPTLNSPSVAGTLNQNCANSTQVVSGSTIYPCNNWIGATSLTPNVGQSLVTQNYLYDNFYWTGPGSNPGTNGAINSFDETLGNNFDLNATSYQRGNHAGFGTTITKYGGGDVRGADIGVTGFANAQAGGDEGLEGIRVEADQTGYPRGTITSGASSGSTALITNVTGWNDQGYLLDLTQAAGTAVITVQSPLSSNPGINSQTQTVSGLSMTPSTAWGNMVPSSVTYLTSPVGLYQNYTSVTANIVLSTSPASPGPFSTGPMTCSGNNLEQVQVTAVGAVSSGVQSVTFLSRNGWDGSNGNTNQAICMQGGSVAGDAFVATSTVSSWPAAYPIVGALSSTVMVYANCFTGQCNGVNTTNLLPNYTAISLYPYAEIIKSVTTANVATGGVNLGYNTVPFANEDSVVGAPAVSATITGIHVNMQLETPSRANTINDLIDTSSVGISVNDIGLQPINAYFIGSNSRSSYNTASALLGGVGQFQNLVLAYHTPISGGCMICVQHDNSEGSSFTGSIAGTTLTVSALASGYIQNYQELVGTGISAPCLIISYTLGSGTPGGVGSYTISCNPGTISSESMSTVKGLYTIFGNTGSYAPILTYDSLTKGATLNVAYGNGFLTIPNQVRTYDNGSSAAQGFFAGSGGSTEFFSTNGTPFIVEANCPYGAVTGCGATAMTVSATTTTIPGLTISGTHNLTGVQGTTGTNIAATSGTFTSGNFRSTDSNGNEIDSGQKACGSGGSGTQVCDAAGNWISSGSGSVTSVSVATANGFQGTSSGGATPALTLNTDSTHFLPINNGSSTQFLTGVGSYTAIPLGSAVSGTLGAGNGGTGQTTLLASYQALYQTIVTAAGGLTYGGTAGTPTQLSPNTTSTTKCLVETSSVPSWTACQSAAILIGTGASIGGYALSPGSCNSSSTPVTGVTNSMAIVATPQVYPGDGTYWRAYFDSDASAVIVDICAIIATTPVATNYNIRVIP